MRTFFTLEVRGWLYRVAGAAGLVLGGYGLVDDAKLALWLGLVAAVLGNGLASANSPIKPTP